MYTIQSTLNGLYIGKAFGYDHNLSFMYPNILNAHTWKDRIDAVSIALSIGHCVVVELPEEEDRYATVFTK